MNINDFIVKDYDNKTELKSNVQFLLVDNSNDKLLKVENKYLTPVLEFLDGLCKFSITNIIDKCKNDVVYLQIQENNMNYYCLLY